MAKKAAKKAAKKSAKTSARKSVKKSVKKPVKKPAKRTPRGAAPSALSFGPAKKELASLRGKLQSVIDKEGANFTISDIIGKIDTLDAALVCQTIMTPSFP